MKLFSYDRIFNVAWDYIFNNTHIAFPTMEKNDEDIYKDIVNAYEAFKENFIELTFDNIIKSYNEYLRMGKIDPSTHNLKYETDYEIQNNLTLYYNFIEELEKQKDDKKINKYIFLYFKMIYFYGMEYYNKYCDVKPKLSPPPQKKKVRDFIKKLIMEKKNTIQIDEIEGNLLYIKHKMKLNEIYYYAMNLMGRFYEIKENYEKAIYYYKIAVKGKNELAMIYLTEMTIILRHKKNVDNSTYQPIYNNLPIEYKTGECYGYEELAKLNNPKGLSNSIIYYFSKIHNAWDSFSYQYGAGEKFIFYMNKSVNLLLGSNKLSLCPLSFSYILYYYRVAIKNIDMAIKLALIGFSNCNKFALHELGIIYAYNKINYDMVERIIYLYAKIQSMKKTPFIYHIMGSLDMLFRIHKLNNIYNERAIRCYLKIIYDYPIYADNERKNCMLEYCKNSKGKYNYYEIIWFPNLITLIMSIRKRQPSIYLPGEIYKYIFANYMVPTETI